jgi:hypothetical protein
MKKILFLITALAISAAVTFVSCKKETTQPAEGSTAEMQTVKAPKAAMSVPCLACVSNTQASVTLTLCTPTGGTGAPAGFSVQWMTRADYDLYGWPATDDNLCKAGFSGNANLSRYNLLPGECVSITVGDFLFDQGASTNCSGDLACGTEYVFRAFAHASNTKNKSAFSTTSFCSTAACYTSGGCTLTRGYWATHNLQACNPDLPYNDPLQYSTCVQWPVASLTLGTVSYTDLELISILNTVPGTNGLVSLAHQLIAAKLNIANGADGSAVAGAIAGADALIGGLMVPPTGAGSLAVSSTAALTTTLLDYNSGSIGPGHCN